jgi:hypothetical protein
MPPLGAIPPSSATFKVIDLEARTRPVLFYGRTQGDCYAWIVWKKDMKKQRRGGYAVRAA